MSLQDNLKCFRKEKGMSQSDLADKLTVTRQAVSSWETGKSVPDIYTLTRISEIFDVDLEDLLGEINKKNINRCRSDKKELFKQYGKYVVLIAIVFTLACTLPKDIFVPIMFFGKLIIIFFILLFVIYIIIKKYLK